MSADPRPRPNGPEIETIPALHTALASGESLRGLRLQDLDLTGHEAELLARTDVEGMVVLGGRLSRDLEEHLRAHRALVFPTDPRPRSTPTARRSTSRTSCTPGSRAGLRADPDAEAYHWSRDARVHHDAFVTLLRAIHDDSVSDALTEFVGERPVVGVMGGHALARGTSGYAVAARLGHSLAVEGWSWRPAGGPAPWRPRTWGLLRGRTAARGRPREARRGAVLPAGHRAVGEPGPEDP